MSQEVSSIVTQYLLDTQPGLYKVLAATAGTDTTRFVHGLTGIHAQENPDGEWLWVVQDGLGSVTGVVDNNLDLLENRQYAPYGEVWEQIGTEGNNYQFTGEWVDQNNLLYLRARYLNPAFGAFISLDPLETANRYSYANSNPTLYTDPSGMSSVCGIPNLGGHTPNQQDNTRIPPCDYICRDLFGADANLQAQCFVNCVNTGLHLQPPPCSGSQINLITGDCCPDNQTFRIINLGQPNSAGVCVPIECPEGTTYFRGRCTSISLGTNNIPHEDIDTGNACDPAAVTLALIELIAAVGMSQIEMETWLELSLPVFGQAMGCYRAFHMLPVSMAEAEVNSQPALEQLGIDPVMFEVGMAVLGCLVPLIESDDVPVTAVAQLGVLISRCA